MIETITLRSHLSGHLNDISESSGIGVIGKCSIICELVCLFSDYREEGTPLFLDAFLVDDLEQFLSTIPQSVSMRLGRIPISSWSESEVARAVKSTAPLVRGVWRMYFALHSDHVSFGVFRDSAHPLNVPIDIVLGGEARYVRLTRLAGNTLRITNAAGASKEIQFNNSLKPGNSADDSTTKLCSSICSGLTDDRSERCLAFTKNLITTALRSSHGAIVAVQKAEDSILPFLTDCISLETPISIPEAIMYAVEDSSQLPQLYALQSMICGMFCCDGIILFDTNCRILAYNGFITLESSAVSGGARKRAYKSLEPKVGNELHSVFFQSQDGNTEIRNLAV